MSYPKKKWGQNFLIDKNIINKIIDSIDPTIYDTIVEIGPGKGALTIPLSKKVNKVIAVEIDPELSANLSKKGINNLEIVNQDFLKFDIDKINGPIKFIGNLPYNITSPIIFKILSCSKWSKIVIMVQEEVADRIVALPNSKTYGRLSVMLQALSNPKKEFSVSKNCFNPKPKIESAVISLNLLDRKVESIKKFSYMVKLAFSKRRKILNNTLGKEYNKGIIDEYLNKRPEQLSVQDFIDIHKRNLLNKTK